MSIFCFKKLDPSLRLGERFKQHREAAGLPIEQLSEKTHIQIKYLEALECGAFPELPKARAYRLAYVREYAAQLGLDASGGGCGTAGVDVAVCPELVAAQKVANLLRDRR